MKHSRCRRHFSSPANLEQLSDALNLTPSLIVLPSTFHQHCMVRQDPPQGLERAVGMADNLVHLVGPLTDTLHGMPRANEQVLARIRQHTLSLRQVSFTSGSLYDNCICHVVPLDLQMRQHKTPINFPLPPLLNVDSSNSRNTHSANCFC